MNEKLFLGADFELGFESESRMVEYGIKREPSFNDLSDSEKEELLGFMGLNFNLTDEEIMEMCR